MSLAKIAMFLVCASMTLATPGNMARAGDYDASTTASYTAGPPKGITVKGNIVWAVGKPIINYVDGEIVDSDNNLVLPLGSLGFTYDSANRKVTLTPQFFEASGGPLKVRLYWYHNEGGDLMEESESLEITIPANPGEGD
ncbi:hypothetical protein [Singulisphaera acidiphila]|uniref:Uncharacterized protein n=1 Tax=Singulisphaera acidiphila (strain ATCC BAA-1392 / DSM 18658 / VKM B-2454 / MOB10) TaxID=886293 RepID=L0D5R4_SINAD|nr:hypothetical protein [Singulisphaera acidiphila]AGA24759.1 hypothetical protein Sinac_0315 [Singulisphaera acidiphila DSM 18658]